LLTASIFAGELREINWRPFRFRRPFDCSGGRPMLNRRIRALLLMQRMAERGSDQKQSDEDSEVDFTFPFPPLLFYNLGQDKT